MSLPIKGSYILFFRRNTSTIPNYLEFFIIDCYAGIRLPNAFNRNYTEVTTNSSIGISEPQKITDIETFYATRTNIQPINNTNIGIISYNNFNIYVSPHYENNNILNLARDPPREDDDFNFTNLPGGGFEICDNSGTSRRCPPELNNACRETSEELGINEDTFRRFLMDNNLRINVEYNVIHTRRGRQLVYIFIVDLDRIEYENPNADYTDIQMILTERVTNPASIPSRTPYVNEYYRARWIPESDTIPDASGNIRAGKVYTHKFRRQFDNLIRSSIQRDLSVAQSTWTPFVAPSTVITAAAVPSASAWSSPTTTLVHLGLAPPTPSTPQPVVQTPPTPPPAPPAPRTGSELIALLTESQKMSLKDHINSKIRDKKNIPERRIYNEIEKYLISINIILRDEDELKAFTEKLFELNPLKANKPNVNFKQKYLKYKQKYLELKKQLNKN